MLKYLPQGAWQSLENSPIPLPLNFPRKLTDVNAMHVGVNTGEFRIDLGVFFPGITHKNKFSSGEPFQDGLDGGAFVTLG